MTNASTEGNDDRLWDRAYELAWAEATHDSEIQARAIVYYWKLRREVEERINANS